ncbi:hypothetical protein JZ751_023554 [Albula glossodonta]|uniref:Uncharacterized protein n=1 Tax=Albula glossodonta TaxID=121402 RepID=A0A8T2MRB2_9TELE|nr:hypothetical protein JZ751_023554 [Albula glossodonta]
MDKQRPHLPCPASARGRCADTGRRIPVCPPCEVGGPQVAGRGGVAIGRGGVACGRGPTRPEGAGRGGALFLCHFLNGAQFVALVFLREEFEGLAVQRAEGPGCRGALLGQVHLAQVPQGQVPWGLIRSWRPADGAHAKSPPVPALLQAGSAETVAASQHHRVRENAAADRAGELISHGRHFLSAKVSVSRASAEMWLWSRPHAAVTNTDCPPDRTDVFKVPVSSFLLLP